MKTSNRANGTRFERELSGVLSRQGFWCHLMTQSKAGQPADLIVAIGKYHSMIDCKVISNSGGFPFDRAEDNQRNAMMRFLDRANFPCWFALKLQSGEIRMFCHLTLLMLEKEGIKSLHKNEIENRTMALEEWVEYAKQESCAI